MAYPLVKMGERIKSGNVAYNRRTTGLKFDSGGGRFLPVGATRQEKLACNIMDGLRINQDGGMH